MFIPGKYFFSVLLLTCMLSCKKENSGTEDEVQGVNFNLLIKTILRSPDNSAEIITIYDYNSSGELIETSYFSRTNGISSPQKTIEAFYRSFSKIDSVILLNTDMGTVTYKGKTLFTYDGTGKISKSIYISTPGYSPGSQLAKDSSLYLYNGNQLVQRTDYRSHDNNPYILLRTLNYSYDAAGNLTLLRPVWTTNPSIDSVKFTFDNKPNSAPVERRIYFWAPCFYNDYRFINNPTSKTAINSESFTYHYRYTSNNKPLYRKEKKVGSPAYGELYYFYD